jgi:tetratricopeptide (TPR) repeat protein
LEQSPYLNILPESRIREALKFMGRSGDERVTRDVAREICLREGVKAMMLGSISSLGSHYVVTLEAVNAENSDSLAREQVEAESKEQVLKSLDRAASSLRGKLGESIGSMQKFDTPLEAATTSSLDALKEFSLGQAEHQKFDDEAAIPHLKRAVELDPNFAMALAVLGVASNNTGNSKEASEYLKKAFDVRERASERERFYISSHYYGTVTKQADKYVETLEEWIRAYPRDGVALDNLALEEQELGQHEKALANASEALRVNPKDAYAYQNVSASYQYLNRYEEAKTVAEQAIAQKIDPWSLHMTLYWDAFVRGDDVAMQREVAQAAGKVYEPIIDEIRGEGQCALGKVTKARESFTHGASAAQAHGNKEFGAWNLEAQASCDAEVGFLQEARQAMNAALALSDNVHMRANAALVFASSEDTARSEKLIADLGREFPSDTLLNQVNLPEARALNSLQRNQPEPAVAGLDSAKPYELGADRRLAGDYLAIYVRGEAFLRLHDGVKAAAEFQKILDHRGVDPTSVLCSLTHLGLGRAYAVSGDTARARTAYQDFFALWKDADADVPMLKTAKAEYEKLK